MNGLMTGGEVHSGIVCQIPESLMSVVKNAISCAWAILNEQVRGGHFQICGAHEDTITEQLHMILGKVQSDGSYILPEILELQTPVREGNLRNWNGSKLDCQPDLTFRPTRKLLNSNNAVAEGVFVECKPIDLAHPVGSEYCKKGLNRFVIGDYAWAVDRALMVGYVRNICPMPDGLNYILSKSRAKRDYKILSPLLEVYETKWHDQTYRTKHGRTIPPSPITETPEPIELDHLWLYTDEPCESTRCQC